MDNNYTQFWGKGNREDVRLSYEDYFEIINLLNDERLSRKAQMNFKNLAEINFYGTVSMLCYCTVPGLALTALMAGRAQRSHSGYRYQWPYFFLAYPITCWFAFTLPIPRRLYTEILTDPDIDGTYIRNTIKYSAPGLWRKISRQLFNKGYRFPELNEATEGITRFPSDFVHPYS
jgi:hypothetical protein